MMMLISLAIFSAQLLLTEGNRGRGMICHMMMLISLAIFSAQLLLTEGNRGRGGGGIFT